jgi:hypothetical protein
MFRVQLGLLAGLLACFLTTLPVAAASPTDQIVEGILLSPVSKHYSVKSGTSRTDTFKVINDGKTAFDFVVYARPYSVNDESYQPDFVSNAQNADAYKWVQFDQPSYHVDSGQSVDVKYTLRVPANATPGGHYGVLFAETQANEQTAGNVVKRTKRVGAILYVTVEGTVTTSGKIEGSDVPFFQFGAPLKIRERVSNHGNTDFMVTTDTRVSDIFGGLKYKAEKEAAVLPQTTRSIVNDWVNPAWIGVYKVEQHAKFLDTERTTSSYVLLIPIWVYLTLGILIGGRILYAMVRRRKK